MTQRKLLPLALAAALAGCGDDSPSPAGSYTLVRTQHGPLPAFLGDRENCRYSAVGGGVQLEPGRRFGWRLDQQSSCAPRIASTPHPAMELDTTTTRGEGTYAVEGDSIVFRNPQGEPTGYGVLRADTLVVRGPGQTMYYLRERGS